jgi:16S rRNA (adenine1518-N6/adenine1519-N6)-dimethyltransferase
LDGAERGGVMSEPSNKPAADEAAEKPMERAAAGTRQTSSFLKELLESQGLRPRRQLGQNFLIDLNLLELLVRAATIEPNDVVLEIGAGTGGLTTRLAMQAAGVVAVEIDPGFHRLVSREVASFLNVELLHADALAGKNKMNPEVTAAVARLLEKYGAPYYRLVANLPYDVASSVVGNLLVDDLPIRSMTITVQYEVGLRMAASPGSRDYGPLSALIQRVGSVEWVRTLPPTVFWPRPKIDSCILRIDVDDAKRQPLDKLRIWHRFVRDLFMQRRKMLRSAVASVPGYKIVKPRLDALLSDLDLSGDVRSERLTHDELWSLWEGVERLRSEMEKG